MKLLRPVRQILLMVAACAVLAVPAQAQAQTASHLEKPLMVVRFNQERIHFQQPLYAAISRALEAKPSVMFTVVSLVPETGNPRVDERISADARHSTGVFVNEMLKMGVPQQRIRVDYQKNRGVESNEVHLFVE